MSIRTISQYTLKNGAALRVFCGEELWGSARVMIRYNSFHKTWWFQLYEYQRMGHTLGPNGIFFGSVADWLETFDEEPHKLAVKIDGEEEPVHLTTEYCETPERKAAAERRIKWLAERSKK